AQINWVFRGRVEVSEDIDDVGGIDDLRHGFNELAGELEWTRHQVRDVAATQDIQIYFCWDQRIQVRAEVINATQQVRRVARHVNARNHDEGALARRAGMRSGSQTVQTCAGTDR